MQASGYTIAKKIVIHYRNLRQALQRQNEPYLAISSRTMAEKVHRLEYGVQENGHLRL